MLAALVSCLATTASGAEVVFIGKTFAAIDAGRDDGLAKDDEVCFVNGEGKQVACGKIGAIRKHICGIRLAKKKKLKSLTMGMKITSKNLKEAEGKAKVTQEEIEAFVEAATKHEQEQEAKEEKPRAKPLTSSQEMERHPRLVFDILDSLIMPFSYQIPAYDLKQELSGSGSIWRSDRKVTASKLGFELSLAIPVSQSLAIVPGLHYRQIQGDKLDVDYEPTNAAQYGEGSTSATSEGLSVLAETGVPLASWLLLTGDGGLDIDQSTVQFKETELGGASAVTVADVTSKMTVISLRGGGKANFVFGRGSVGLGLQLLLPVIGSPSTSAAGQNLKTTVSAGQAASSAGDLQKALAHKRATFGAQITLGFGFVF